MTYREAIILGERLLSNAGIETVRNDAWHLMSMSCKINLTYYYMHIDEEVPAEQAREFETLIRKRAERIPLQYITGEQEFMGLPFKVNSSVLIPRQDTETLVEVALKKIKPGMRVMDMCTGCGCILISLLKQQPGIKGYGYDISKQAITLAKENARKNEVVAVFEHSNLFEEVEEKKFDIIVCNPPYIRSDEIASLMPEVSLYEPTEALDGHEDGLYFYREIIRGCENYLQLEGWLIFEIGYDQGAAVSGMLRDAGFLEVQVIQDLSHNDRVVIAQQVDCKVWKGMPGSI